MWQVHRHTAVKSDRVTLCRLCALARVWLQGDGSRTIVSIHVLYTHGNLLYFTALLRIAGAGASAGETGKASLFAFETKVNRQLETKSAMCGPLAALRLETRKGGEGRAPSNPEREP